MKIRNTPEILKSLAGKAGCDIYLEPEYELAGRISFSDGRNFYFKNTSFDINGYGASEIAKDKGYTRFFMQSMGYKIPRGQAFFSDYWCEVNGTKNDSSAAVKFANSLGYPVIIKPNSGSKGRDVFKAYDEIQLKEILALAFQNNNIILVEEFVPGSDYRTVVMGNKVEIAYRRSPLSVIGDGENTLSNLLENKRYLLQKIGRKIKIEISDERITERLKNFYEINSSYIAKIGEEIILLENANLSSGGGAVDVTDIMHESYRKMAIKLAKDMGLNFAGVDFITADDITKPINDPTFIEINSSPGLTHYMTLNKEAVGRVEDLYYRILLALKNSAII